MQTDTKRLVLITGGGSGIGLAIARKFAAAGYYHIIIVGRDEKKLAAVREELGESCTTYSRDLSDLASIPSLVQEITEKQGVVEILVNNAGINQKKEFQEVTDEDFQRIITTNLTAVFALSREVVKGLLSAQRKGCIINISSMASQYGIPKVISYTASKSAIEGMTRAMAVELSPKGIRVNCIAPGFIATDMSAKALDSDPERKAKALGRTPMGVLGQPSDIGDAAFFLASDLSAYITGVVLPVDGGNSVGF